MTGRMAAVTLVVPDYDTAIAFYCGALGFELLEDTKLSETKRWVRVAPAGGGAALLLARAEGQAQQSAIGNQTGGRVAFLRRRISAVIIRPSHKPVYPSWRHRATRPTGSSPSSPIPSATVGI